MLYLPVLVLAALGAASAATGAPLPEDEDGGSPALATAPQEPSRRVAEPPRPRGVENPSGAGGRFGLGLDLLSDRVDGLETTASRTTVTLFDPDGSEESFVRPGDPELENRKLDRELTFRGFGLQAPVSIPSFSLGPAVAIYPSIVLEATIVEAELEFIPRTEPGPRTSVKGTGVMLGLGVEWVASACRRCRLFWGGGYRYRLLPDLELERSVAAGGPGLEVRGDDIHLSAESHRVNGRVGYAFRDGRFAPYLGLRYRTTELEIEDELRLAGAALGQETGLATRTELESEGAAGLLGADVTIARRFAVRAEVALGDDEASALLKLVAYLGDAPGPPRPPRSEVEELLANGPRLVLTHWSVEADGLLRGDWPVVVQYILSEEGVLHLTIEAPSHRRLDYPLPGKAGERESEKLYLPADLGDELLAGHLSLRAVSAGGGEIPFQFMGLGAGEGAIKSLAIEDVRLGSPDGRRAEYKFRLVRPFSVAAAELLLWPPPKERRPATLQWSEEFLDEADDCVNTRGQPCFGKWEATEPGLYVLQVRAWSRDRQRGHWLAAVSPEEVFLTP